MSDLSQPWCMVPTEPTSDSATQAPAVVNESNAEMKTSLTDVAIEGEKDEIYYWDTVRFFVGGVRFKVPRYQFVIGSTYFAEKLESVKVSDKGEDEAPITLEGATASQFRILLKLLFPIHTTSTTLTFTKEEWLVILELSTLWSFHEFRKLAKEHLEPLLDDPIERIVLGRAAYISKWVLDGYETLVTRSERISEQESERIGHLTAVRLYILRHERWSHSEPLPSWSSEERSALQQLERGHMSCEEKRIEEEKRLAVETQRRDREEQQRLAEEKAEKIQMETDEQNRKIEELRLEADRIAKELAALKPQEEREREEREKEAQKYEKQAPVGWGWGPAGFGAKKPSISSVARSTTGPTPPLREWDKGMDSDPSPPSPDLPLEGPTYTLTPAPAPKVVFANPSGIAPLSEEKWGREPQPRRGSELQAGTPRYALGAPVGDDTAAQRSDTAGTPASSGRKKKSKKGNPGSVEEPCAPVEMSKAEAQ
ncbi:hypothetical protein MD484_g491, partial [Candolleomyces efflorescens]